MAVWTRLVTDDPIIEEVQDKLAPQMRALERDPLTKGVLLTNKVIDGETDVLHGLGRAPLGWFVVRQRDTTLLKDAQDSNSNPKKTLRLVSAVACTVDLWIF